jgi:hypothetical protein
MTISRHARPLLAAAIFAAGVAMCEGAEAAPAKQDAAAAAKEKARKGTGSADVQKLIEQLRDQRDALIKDHDALAKELKDATEEQKKAIRAKMEARMKEFEEAQSTLAKQIRDEQRRQRQNANPRK